MKAVILWLAFTGMIIASPYIADKIVDWQFPIAGQTLEERKAMDELVKRSLREADEHHRKQKPSLSDQAMIVKDLYAN